MNEELLKDLKHKLKLEHYSMNNDWFADCVEFYLDEHKNASMQEILEFVKAQWQLSDLREINNQNGSFPPNLSRQKFTTLSEIYAVQVEQMYDISTSKYRQLEKIRNIHVPEAEPSDTEKSKKWELPQKRMIQLRLTDGLQNLIGIEYSHVPQFDEILLPGYKALIIGPVKCYKGVLLLVEGSFKGIGGEVETLLIPNALENILARALNLQENPDPYNDNKQQMNNIERKEDEQVQANLFDDDFEIDPEEVSKIEYMHTEVDIRNECTVTLNGESHIGGTEASNKKTISYEEERISNNDDCIFRMVDENQFVESQIEQRNITVPSRTSPEERNNNITVIHDNDREEIMDERSILRNTGTNASLNFNSSLPSNKEELLERKINDSLRLNTPQCSNKTGLSTEKVQNDFINQSSALSSNNTSSLETKEQPPVKRSVPISPSIKKTAKKGKTNELITECTTVLHPPQQPKLNCDLVHTVKNKVVTEAILTCIRGRVETFGKLTKRNLSWTLEATVTDGTASMEVFFSNEVLKNLIGFSVNEFMEKKKCKTDPKVDNELRMGLRGAEQAIKTLDALLQLELSVNKKPTVIRIMDLTEHEKEEIDNKVQNFFREQ